MAPVNITAGTLELAKKCQGFYEKRIQRINKCDVEILMRNQVINERRTLAEIGLLTRATPQDTVDLKRHCLATNSFTDKNIRNLRELATRQYETALRVKSEFLAALKGTPSRIYAEPK